MSCPPTGSAARIVATAQQARVVVQDLCPLAECLEWELGQHYLEEGGGACLNDSGLGPSGVNHDQDGPLARGAAEVLFAGLSAAEGIGTLPDELRVLEVGIDGGLFAHSFLNAFRELCVRNDRDYYDRLCYMAADRSKHMLSDASRQGVLAAHPGHYQLLATDVLRPQESLAPHAPFHAVFLNRVLGTLPATILELSGAGIRQLYVRTCLARCGELDDYSDMTAAAVVRRAAARDPAARRDLLRLVDLLALEYAYRPASIDQVPAGRFGVQFARASGLDILLHSHSALRCLNELLPCLHDAGFIFISDQRQPLLTCADDLEQQLCWEPPFIGVNFQLLEAYGKSQGCCWITPGPEGAAPDVRLIGKGVLPEAVTCFQERFGPAAVEWAQEPLRRARRLVSEGRYEAAAAAYRQALERQADDWALMGEVAVFLTSTLRCPEAGRQMAQTALSLNSFASSGLWNVLGISLLALDRVSEAHDAFRRAVEINPSDAGAYYHLGRLHTERKDYAPALTAIAHGLSADRTGEYRQELLQCQADILQRLSQCHRRQRLLQASRLSRAPLDGDLTAPEDTADGASTLGKSPETTPPKEDQCVLLREREFLVSAEDHSAVAVP